MKTEITVVDGADGLTPDMLRQRPAAKGRKVSDVMKAMDAWYGNHRYNKYD